MNVWNKVFLGVIFVTTIAILVLAAVEFHIRNTALRIIADRNDRITQIEERRARLNRGADPLRLSVDRLPAELSIEELRGLVREQYIERGRAWFGCIVNQVTDRPLPPALVQVVADVTITGPRIPDASGALTNVAQPDALRGVVYVFEERVLEEGADGTGATGASAFLGRFNVDGTPTPTNFPDDDGNQISGWRVTLVSSDSICNNEINQIFDSAHARSRWSIYLTPPVDRIAGIFSQLTDEEMEMIPAELRERFQPRPLPDAREGIERLVAVLRELRDDPNAEPDAQGEASAAIEEWEQTLENWERNQNVIGMWERYRTAIDDPEAELASDFAAALDWHYRLRSNALRVIAIIEANIATHERALERAIAENETLENEAIPLEESRLATMEIQRNAVGALLEQYETEIDRMLLEIEHLKTLAREYLVAIAEAQFRAAERIEERARNATRALEEVR